MRKLFLGMLLICIYSFPSYTQNTIIEGYVLENKNGVYLDAVAIQVYKKNTNQLVVSSFTDKNGIFSVLVPAGEKYVIKSTKAPFKTQKTKINTQKEDQDKKVVVKIKMFRKMGSLLWFNKRQEEEIIVDTQTKIKTYSLDDKKIAPSTKSDTLISEGLSMEELYAQVTNATRLTAENYKESLERETMKWEKTPTSYVAPVIRNELFETKRKTYRLKTPDSYETALTDHNAIPSKPYFGETVVAKPSISISTSRTQKIPKNYSGYKIEFLTSLDLVAGSHPIFRRHGAIFLEQKNNGLFSYLLGSFTDKKVADTFLAEVILPTYPNAQLIFFNKGIRGRKIVVHVKNKPATTPPR